MSETRDPDAPTMDELKERLNGAKERNAQRMKILSQYGQLDPNGVVMTRLEVLIDCLLDEESRLIFEIKFEETMERAIEQAIQEAQKSQLVLPDDKTVKKLGDLS